MGSRKGMRAQEQQAREGNELSGASAGNREPGTRRDPDTGRHSIEEPPADDDRSTLSPSRSDDSDDIENFDDDDDAADEENDLA